MNTSQKSDIGIIGLSVMGRSLALNMADHGFKVSGYNRSASVTEQVMEDHPHENLFPFYSLDEFVNSLEHPRKVMLMIQAGAPVDAVIDQLIPLLEQGDIVMDGGNSFFEDTRRRSKTLAEAGIHYLGVGISGGEEGARFGPSIMPGGEESAYQAVRPILDAIAAKAMGDPCCAYIGPDGAGHYVKMVHNGIEYADMQLIAEAYLLLKYVGNFSNLELSDIFREWNQGELKSYLIGITAGIFREADDLDGGQLIDRILDSAKQKGTGRWASIESLKQGVDISMITSACGARILSNHLDERKMASAQIEGPAIRQADDRAAFAETVRRALYAGKIIAYAQGFSLMQDASERYGWNLDLGTIASIFRAGCIIQAVFLDDITKAYEADSNAGNLMFHPFFRNRINEYQESLRRAASTGVLNGLPVPALSQAASYLDAFRSPASGANLIQAQRDCFGAHTYERTDRPGSFHHEWRITDDN
ncbi:NADP-dependent phosphogluconate dehydrogenase [Enterocloster sp.]|uniref:NADP-dependent phosphogluconate dehydrogenase n=1 Tax=Enterocloster sp. TaxID=2719315 RepID=UPI00284C1A9C|nr:NADP-dependent phosphogluconate dehydrogenase [Enterocloster sp.]MDR3758169.1 NADP-dependent phosphogluconate dehydrogenase [Enterocloster sp.]